MRFWRPKLVHCCILAVIFLSGCGTMANVEGRKIVTIGEPLPEQTRVFGGVRQDAFMIAALVDVTWSIPEISLGSFPAGMCFLLDLPFSCVGDLLTMPMIMTDSIPEGLRFKKEKFARLMPDEAKQMTPVSLESQDEKK